MRNRDLDQYFTPSWAAEILVDTFYGDLDPVKDRVVEPACGDGRFLMALPKDVPAIGVEIDARVAEEARANTGRDILTGDFAEMALPFKPTLILGNPPFKATFLDMLLDRAAELLEEDGRMGLLLPVYLFQTASTVMRYRRHFSIEQNLVPRNLFQNMQKPLLWANFTRQKSTVLSGFLLYEELDALNSIQRRYKTVFVGNASRASVWGELVERALIKLGGKATLQQLYAEIENDRPTDNPWWRPRIRNIVMKHYPRVERATYALEAA